MSALSSLTYEFDPLGRLTLQESESDSVEGEISFIVERAAAGPYP